MKKDLFMPRVKSLWISWFAIFPTIIFFKLLHFPLFKDLPVSIVYFIYFIFLIIISAVKSENSRNYIKSYHPLIFDKISHVKFLGGSGNYNSFKMLDFIDSPEVYEDEVLNKIKDEYSRLHGFIIFVFILFPICSVIGFII